MSRTSGNAYKEGLLWNGYDYIRQAWVKDGVYVSCGHPESIPCTCYGRKHEGEIARVRESAQEVGAK
jgi:hypothetical protein